MAQAKKALAKKSRSLRKAKRAPSFYNYIDGRWVPSKGDEWSENRNPADTRDVIGRFPHSTEADIDDAVAAAVACTALLLRPKCLTSLPCACASRSASAG